MNFTFKETVIGGKTNFLDSDKVRYIRGGVTLDAAEVTADPVTGIKKLLAGTFVGKLGSGKYAKYIAAVAASLNTGVIGSNNAITWAAVAAGNDITVALVNPGTASAALGVVVAGTDITVNLATNAAVKASGTSGVEGSNNGLTYTAKDFGGNDIVVILEDPDGNNQVLSVAVKGTAIIVSLATDGAGAITTTAAQVIAAIEGNAEAAALIDVDNTGASTGAAAVTDQVVQLANGVDQGVVSTAAEVIAAIEASATASALVGVDNTGASTGAGVVAAVGQTNLAGGSDANVTPKAMLADDVSFTTFTTSSGASHADQVVTAIDQARVISVRLPVAPDSVVRTGMPGITWVE